MINPQRQTMPQSFDPRTLRQVTNSIPPGRFPTYPWAAQVQSNPFLSRWAWRGAGGLAALAAAQAAPRLIPGENAVLEDVAGGALRGAGMGAMLGWPGALGGAAIGGLSSFLSR